MRWFLEACYEICRRPSTTCKRYSHQGYSYKIYHLFRNECFVFHSSFKNDLIYFIIVQQHRLSSADLCMRKRLVFLFLSKYKYDINNIYNKTLNWIKLDFLSLASSKNIFKKNTLTLWEKRDSKCSVMQTDYAELCFRMRR